MARVHLLLALFWVAMLVPTVLWWYDSVAYVVAMSWYAIVVSHLSALAACRAEEKVDEKLDATREAKK
jgi:hypothetical protein